MKLIYNVEDKPKFGQTIVFAIQQLLAIMAATLVVPVIVGNGIRRGGPRFSEPQAAAARGRGTRSY